MPHSFQTEAPPGEDSFVLSSYFDLVCLTAEGDRVYVMVSGATISEHGHRVEFITIGVRDSDSDDKMISRDEYRELINVDPPDAIRLARFLLDYATDMLDSDDVDDPDGVDDE